MMWYPGMTAAGWGMMLVGTLITLIFWGSVIALVVWAVRYLAPRPRTDEPAEILRRRFAAGEMSQAEYDQARRTLEH